MNEIKINSYRILENGNKKSFCVYIVEANINGIQYEVEKRYSQFLNLHNELKNLCATPYFPPKKVRSLQQKVLEKRRLALETYLQTMLQFCKSRGHVLSFLNIDSCDGEHVGSEKYTRNNIKLDHQPIFQLNKYLMMENYAKSNIADIIVEGTLLGIYNST